MLESRIGVEHEGMAYLLGARACARAASVASGPAPCTLFADGRTSACAGCALPRLTGDADVGAGTVQPWRARGMIRQKFRGAPSLSSICGQSN